MRRAALVLALVVVVCGAVVGRSVWEGQRALAAGDAAAAHGDRSTAVAAWRRAAEWTVPLAPHVAAARSRLAGAAADRGAPGPAAPWTVVALLGLSLWIGGAVHFARRGLDDAERLVARDAAAAAALVAVGLVTWMVGLYAA
jgi:hypothetical protein